MNSPGVPKFIYPHQLLRSKFKPNQVHDLTEEMEVIDLSQDDKEEIQTTDEFEANITRQLEDVHDDINDLYLGSHSQIPFSQLEAQIYDKLVDLVSDIRIHNLFTNDEDPLVEELWDRSFRDICNFIRDRLPDLVRRYQLTYFSPNKPTPVEEFAKSLREDLVDIQNDIYQLYKPKERSSDFEQDQAYIDENIAYLMEYLANEQVLPDDLKREYDEIMKGPRDERHEEWQKWFVYIYPRIILRYQAKERTYYL